MKISKILSLGRMPPWVKEFFWRLLSIGLDTDLCDLKSEAVEHSGKGTAHDD
jgi:hypothetical protein